MNKHIHCKHTVKEITWCCLCEAEKVRKGQEALLVKIPVLALDILIECSRGD